MTTAFPPIAGPMPTASQPSAKRIRLDDSQVQTQGTVMVVVRWYILMLCVQEAILLLSVKTLYFFRSHIDSVELNWAFSAQVSLTLIWVEHPTATSTSRFNFRKATHTVVAQLSMLIDGLAAYCVRSKSDLAGN